MGKERQELKKFWLRRVTCYVYTYEKDKVLVFLFKWK